MTKLTAGGLDDPRDRDISQMGESWYFDLEGTAKHVWIWRRVASDGEMLVTSRRFCFYSDAVEDARQHGFTGTPRFGKPPPHEHRRVQGSRDP